MKNAKLLLVLILLFLAACSPQNAKVSKEEIDKLLDSVSKMPKFDAANELKKFELAVVDLQNQKNAAYAEWVRVSKVASNSSEKEREIARDTFHQLESSLNIAKDTKTNLEARVKLAEALKLAESVINSIVGERRKGLIEELKLE